MPYKDWDGFAEDHGIKIVGWPDDIPFLNPSHHSTSKNQRLLKLVNSGTIHFVRTNKSTDASEPSKKGTKRRGVQFKNVLDTPPGSCKPQSSDSDASDKEEGSQVKAGLAGVTDREHDPSTLQVAGSSTPAHQPPGTSHGQGMTNSEYWSIMNSFDLGLGFNGLTVKYPRGMLGPQ